MNITSTKLVRVEFSIYEDMLINKACEICGEHRWAVHHAETVDEMHQKLFDVHGCLDSRSGGDMLCDILDGLACYKGEGYSVEVVDK
jgi:hypothetical protein